MQNCACTDTRGCDAQAQCGLTVQLVMVASSAACSIFQLCKTSLADVISKTKHAEVRCANVFLHAGTLGHQHRPYSIKTTLGYGGVKLCWHSKGPQGWEQPEVIFSTKFIRECEATHLSQDLYIWVCLCVLERAVRCKCRLNLHTCVLFMEAKTHSRQSCVCTGGGNCEIPSPTIYTVGLARSQSTHIQMVKQHGCH